jgi:uncharacterized protein (DUF486 family)
VKTVILLIISNAFMNIAWYGHLKYRNEPLLLVILASWGIALFEYIFQVPANRIGAEKFTVTQLKIMQEGITLAVFTVIAYVLFHETLRWNNIVSYALIIAAVYFAFLGQRKQPEVTMQSEKTTPSSALEKHRVIASTCGRRA